MTDKAKGTALITGASSGIGAVYADRLARRGYDLILVARDRARLEALAERLRAETGRTIELLRADLTDKTDLAGVEARLATDASITLLINNAGKSMRGSLTQVEPEEIEDMLALNTVATTRLAGAAAKAFAQRRHGAIVNMSSILALMPEFGDGVYSGTKAHLLNVSLSLAHQLRDRGVHVQAVLPGATRTEIWERAGKDLNSFPPEWVMEVDDLVDAALVGFDRGEEVTIPPLADEADWARLNGLRLEIQGRLSNREVAPRYREPALT
jgi:short-subunit dehydrogenase